MTSGLTINVRNIVKNYKAIEKYVGKQVKVASVVKCDCYGLGMAQIAPSLFEAGCREFYVAELNEGLALRKLIKTGDIYVLHGIEAGEERKFLKAKLIPVINNLNQIAIWARAAKTAKKKLKCSLHIDSGMTRLGIEPYLVDKAISLILNNKSLEVCYIVSHLACSWDSSNKMNKIQLDFMLSLKKKYPGFKYSFSNSTGIFLGKSYLFDQVRPGGALYGEKLGIALSGIVKLTSNIIDIHVIKKEQSIGYNASYTLKPGMVTATIPLGYGDGYPRRLGNVSYCYIKGIKVNIIGVISMDLISLDISHLPKTLQRIGQEVELIGDNISIEKISELADTVNYEILTALGGSFRYTKKYIN